MKKRLGDITIAELKLLCKPYKTCAECPLHRYECYSFRLIDYLDDLIDLPDSTAVPEEMSSSRAFNDCDELIEEFCHRFGVVEVDHYLPFIWVSSIATGHKYLIHAFGFGERKQHVHTTCWLSLKELFANYTFLDGSPCGIVDRNVEED